MFLLIIGIITAILTTFGLYTSMLLENPLSGPYVYYINFKPESDHILQELAKLYTEKTGINVTVLSAKNQNYEEILQRGLSESKPATLYVATGFQSLIKYADNIYDLRGTKVVNELTSDDYKLVDKKGRLGAIGYCYETFGIIVNLELLEIANHTIDEIKNFDTLKKVVNDIHSRAKKLGFDAFTSSGLDDSSSWRFSAHLANVPLFYESRDDGNWKSTPSKIKGTYLSNFKNIWDLYIQNSAYPPNTLKTGNYNFAEEFGNKKAVFYQNGNWEYDSLVNNYKLDPKKLTMIPIYSGVEGEENAGLNSGTENYWAVNKKAPKEAIKATLDFMYWLVTDEEATKSLALTFGYIPFKKAYPVENVFLIKANELSKEGKYTMLWKFILTPNLMEWRKNFVDALDTYSKSSTASDWIYFQSTFVNGWSDQYKKENNQ